MRRLARPSSLPFPSSSSPLPSSPSSSPSSSHSRLQADGVADRIAAIAVNPGAVNSDIWRTFPRWCMCFARPLMNLLFLTTSQGAATSIEAATSPRPGGWRLEPGDRVYLTPYSIPSWATNPTLATLFDSLGPFRGARFAASSPISFDPASASALWRASEAAVAKVGAQTA